MIVQHREPADGNRENVRKFLESLFDPFSAVGWSFGEQECAADAAGDAVVPARDGYVDEVGASHRHEWDSGCDLPNLPKHRRRVKIAMHVLVFCQYFTVRPPGPPTPCRSSLRRRTAHGA